MATLCVASAIHRWINIALENKRRSFRRREELQMWEFRNFCSLTFSVCNLRMNTWHLYYVNMGWKSKQSLNSLHLNNTTWKCKKNKHETDIFQRNFVYSSEFFFFKSSNCWWHLALMDSSLSSNSFIFASLASTLLFKLSTNFSLIDRPSGVRLWLGLTLYSGKLPPLSNSFL